MSSAAPSNSNSSSSSSGAGAARAPLQKADWENAAFPLGGNRIPKGMEEHANWQDLPEVSTRRGEHQRRQAGARQRHRQEQRSRSGLQRTETEEDSSAALSQADHTEVLDPHCCVVCCIRLFALLLLLASSSKPWWRRAARISAPSTAR